MSCLIRRHRPQKSWAAAIAHVVELPFNSPPRNRLSSDAANWCHCAVGSILDPPVPDGTVNKAINGVLHDSYPDLRELGVNFYECITQEEYEDAKYWHDRIQKYLTPATVQGIRRRVNRYISTAVWPDAAVGAGASTLGVPGA